MTCAMLHGVRTRSEAPSAADPTTKGSRKRLIFTVFDALCNAKGLTTDGQKARAIGIDPSHLSHMRAGRYGAGPEVIHKALELFPPIRYQDLFEEATS